MNNLPQGPIGQVRMKTYFPAGKSTCSRWHFFEPWFPQHKATKSTYILHLIYLFISTTSQLDASPLQSLQFKVMETKGTQCMQKWWHLTMSWLSWTLELNKVTNLVTYWYKMYVEWEELAGENHGEEMGMNTDWWEKGKSSMLVLFLLWFIDPCH